MMEKYTQKIVGARKYFKMTYGFVGISLYLFMKNVNKSARYNP